MISDDSSDDETLVVALCLAIDEEEANSKRLWVKDLNLARETEGEHHTLFLSLKSDNKSFFQYFRMSYEKFSELLQLIEPDIRKHETHFRKCISPEERLALTLRFLGHAGSYRSISDSYRMGESTVRKIIYDTCKSIWHRLSPLVMPPPKPETWKTVADGFANKWQYPNAIGALDGKYVITHKPSKSGSHCFNYKKNFCVALLALVDHECKFLTVDVGAYGENSHGALFKESKLGKNLLANKLDIPPPKTLPNTDIVLPHVIVADEAFLLQLHVMRPFPGPKLSQNIPNKIYNYRHSRARRVSKYAFGILTKKFRIYSQVLQVIPEHLEVLVLATTCLHNFLHDDDENLWQPGELETQEQPAGLENLAMVGGNATNEALQVREYFKDYFSSPEGKVAWQDNMINRGRQNIPLGN